MIFNSTVPLSFILHPSGQKMRNSTRTYAHFSQEEKQQKRQMTGLPDWNIKVISIYQDLHL